MNKKDNKDKNRNKTIVIGIMAVYFVIGIIGLILIMPSAQEAFSQLFRYRKEDVIELVFLLVCLITIVPFFTLFLLLKMDKRKTDHYTSNISNEREYIEKQLHDLNERLSSTAQSWKETNHLLLEAQDRIRKDQTGIASTNKFLDSFGIDDYRINAKQVFVLTPFSTIYDETYDVIKHVCETVKLTAIRSDEEYISSNIMRHIIILIVTSRVIIANIDGSNPNVMYELGIAHALNKPTIIIDKGNQLRPFDIQGNQIIIYDNYNELSKKLTEQLLDVVVNVTT